MPLVNIPDDILLLYTVPQNVVKFVAQWVTMQFDNLEVNFKIFFLCWFARVYLMPARKIV